MVGRISETAAPLHAVAKSPSWVVSCWVFFTSFSFVDPFSLYPFHTKANILERILQPVQFGSFLEMGFNDIRGIIFSVVEEPFFERISQHEVLF